MVLGGMAIGIKMNLMIQFISTTQATCALNNKVYYSEIGNSGSLGSILRKMSAYTLCFDHITTHLPFNDEEEVIIMFRYITRKGSFAYEAIFY